MSLLIKICGLSEQATVDAALEAGADMVGFVFFQASPRHIDLATARWLCHHAAGRAKTVALTVDADDAQIAAIVAAAKPDLIQLHGRETAARVAEVRQLFGRPVIKAIGLREHADLAVIPRFDVVADHLLFDARPPVDADRPGGHGEPFDWTLLRGVTTRRPWFLAGGLTPDIVEAALHQTGAPGLDVSSGVESSPGVKDAGKIARFVAHARNAAAALGQSSAIG